MLAVLAHPDDETFGTGGTLALYAGRGVEVHLVCATRGEAGEMDADCLDGFNSVAERRVSELRCAAGILGLSGVYFLDYRDSGMPGSADNQHPEALINAPLEEVAGHIVHYIRGLKPAGGDHLRSDRRLQAPRPYRHPPGHRARLSSWREIRLTRPV